MNKEPVYADDLNMLGEWLYVEVEGYEKTARMQCGNFMRVFKEILGWECERLSDILKKQKDVNFAPRVRYWRTDKEPSLKDREKAGWENSSRLWSPRLYDCDGMEEQARWEEYLETGRTVWPEKKVPEDPVAWNRELAEKGGEPLAPMCAGCHWGTWDRPKSRWITLKNGKKAFYACNNVGVPGWKHWMKEQTQPEKCDHFCPIGEYAPKGPWKVLAETVKGM